MLLGVYAAFGSGHRGLMAWAVNLVYCESFFVLFILERKAFSKLLQRINRANGEKVKGKDIQVGHFNKAKHPYTKDVADPHPKKRISIAVTTPIFWFLESCAFPYV